MNETNKHFFSINKFMFGNLLDIMLGNTSILNDNILFGALVNIVIDNTL